jgi:cyclopropane-fatty-acyl-phospholipid synthase
MPPESVVEESLSAMERDSTIMWEAVSSPFNYYFGYVSSSLVIIWLFSRALAGLELTSLPRLTAIGSVAFLTWTLFEYWFHRVLYHMGAHSFRAGHEAHHDDPKALLGLPYYIHGLFYVLLYFSLAYFLNPTAVAVFLGFFALGHLSYNVTHHATHHWQRQSYIFRKLRNHHLIHHRLPNRNFGISCPYWDVVFGTHASRSERG